MLLPLFTLSAATTLAFGTVCRRLLGPRPSRLLIREVLVAVLPLYGGKFIGMLLPALATGAHVL